MPTQRDNLLIWGSDIEENTIQQAARASRLPFITGHVALMPDAHFGMGATIGSVIPTQGAIIPSAVGVDIGCGMIAAETSLRAEDLPDDLDALHDAIASVVPAGVGKGFDTIARKCPPIPIHFSQKESSTALKQFGTLGSGNHFVEVELDETDRVWVVLHSGSRGIGNQLATQHIKKAKGLMKEYFIHLEDPDLAYLVEGTPEFDAYIADMLWAQDYAYGSRNAMMDATLMQLQRASKPFAVWNKINCHHNFTQLENHHGKNVWLTRKGAIKADVNDQGVIPGSMATGSFIVTGKGNAASYKSCSHGAGRKMSRTKAKATLTVESLRERMTGKAWNDQQSKALLDEHPDAYKDIVQVMEDQKDLVQIEHTLHQVLNYKGT